jgi:hypothetical protein
VQLCFCCQYASKRVLVLMMISELITDGNPVVCRAALCCPMQVLQAASERVFVPLTVGGGIRGFSAQGKDYPALQVASEYFR